MTEQHKGKVNVLYYDTEDVNIDDKVRRLPKIPGFCIIVDVSGSTRMKYINPKKWDWMIVIKNAFKTVIRKLQITPVKYLGDGLMFYIQQYEHPEITADDIFRTVEKAVIKRSLKKSGHIKAVITYCVNVVGISFVKGSDDYYGLGIDKAFRLISKADKNNILVSSGFYKMISRELKEQGGFEQDDIKLKGIDDLQRIYKYNVVTENPRKYIDAVD